MENNNNKAPATNTPNAESEVTTSPADIGGVRKVDAMKIISSIVFVVLLVAAIVYAQVIWQQYRYTHQSAPTQVPIVEEGTTQPTNGVLSDEERAAIRSKLQENPNASAPQEQERFAVTAILAEEASSEPLTDEERAQIISELKSE